MTKMKTAGRGPGRRGFLGGLMAASAGTVALPGLLRAQPGELIIGCAAGHIGWMEKTVVPMFQDKYGVKLVLEGTRSGVNLEKLRQNKGSQYLSVVMMDDPVLIQAVEEDLVTRLDPSEVPNLPAVRAGAVHMDGMWANYQQPWCGIAYNTGERESVGSWSDLWGAGLASRIIIPSLQNTEGVWPLFFAASVATGKPLSEAQYEIDAAFEKLRELKPNLLSIYTQSPAAFNLLEQGEAAMIAGSASEFVLPRRNEGSPVNLAAPVEGVGALPAGIALVKDGPAAELARNFVNEMLGAEFQAVMTRETYALPTNSATQSDTGISADTPVFAPDWGNVARNRQTWIERFDREIAA